MLCDACRRLMPEALDGRALDAIAAHLDSCAECREVWQAQRRVDAILRSAPSVEPPDDFGRRVLEAVVLADAAKPDWRGGLAQIGLLSTGILGAAWLVVSVGSRLRLSDLGPGALDAAAGTVRGLVLAVGALGEMPVSPTVTALLSALAAVGLAWIWFGATILPREAWNVARASTSARPF